jgi:hypothetical protein
MRVNETKLKPTYFSVSGVEKEIVEVLFPGVERVWDSIYISYYVLHGISSQTGCQGPRVSWSQLHVILINLIKTIYFNTNME